jgi:ABC-type uncharacterized transport system substrate-binding protein
LPVSDKPWPTYAQQIRAPTVIKADAIMDCARTRWTRYLLVLAGIACNGPMATSASAHPHVWVRMNVELLYAPDGSVTAVREAWAFDTMFSAFDITGVRPKIKGQFSRDELAPLAQTNIESLKQFGYFTYATVNGKKVKNAFADPVDYWDSYDAKATVLTLHFTLPFKAPLKANLLKVEIYDPEYFVDLALAGKDAATAVGAPAGCALWTEIPHDDSFNSFMSSEANVGLGLNFANKIIVQCQ